MNNHDMEERTIDLYDLAGKMLSKWKLILACMLAGAILFAAVSYLRSYMQIKNAEVAVAAEDDESEEFEFTSITEQEGEDLLQTAENYQRLIDEANYYLDNSVLMNLNGNATTLYSIYDIYSDNGLLTIEQERYLARAYSLAIVNDEICQKISDKLSPQYDVMPEFVPELFYVTNCLPDNAVTMAQNDDILSTSYSESLGENKATAQFMLYVVFTGYNDEFCETMEAVVSEAIPAISEEINESVNHSINYTGNQIKTSANRSRENDKRTEYQTIKSLQAEITALIKDLTEEEQDYVKQYISGETEVEIEEVQAEDLNELANMKPSVSVKYVVVGALLGAVVVCFLYMMGYCMSGKVHTYTELENDYNQNLLGVIAAENKNKANVNMLDKLLKHKKNVLPKDRVLQLVEQRVRIKAEAENIKRIGVACVASGDNASALQKELVAKLSHDSIEAAAIGNLLEDPLAFDEAKSVDAMIFVVEIENTIAVEICKEIRYCDELKLPIIGTVALA